MKNRSFLLLTALTITVSGASADGVLYSCRSVEKDSISFQDFPCTNKKDLSHVSAMPKGNSLGDSENSGYQGVPMGHWQGRIGRVSHLQNPVENIQLPTLNKVPSLTGAGFIKRETTN